MGQLELRELREKIHEWAEQLGFCQVGFSDTKLDDHGKRLKDWLKAGLNADMKYMAKYGNMRWTPGSLKPGTKSIISVRINYLEKEPESKRILKDRSKGFISKYAQGRDYHRTIRNKLKLLEKKIKLFCEEKNFDGFESRLITDSAPLLEKAVAVKAGLGWIGKNTLLINKTSGSYFFLGEILTNLPLAEKGEEQPNLCGKCQACIKTCPTQAILGPYTLDAKRCISYLTIENRGAIPEKYRKALGNRIFGCDDCQIVCPWNRYAKHNVETDFKPRHGLDNEDLEKLFLWSKEDFNQKTAGSAIRRAGYDGWLRNIAVALGNAEKGSKTANILLQKKGLSNLVDEHINWALDQHAKDPT